MSFAVVPGVLPAQMVQVMAPDAVPVMATEPAAEPVKAAPAVVAPKRRKTESAAGL